MPPRKRAAAKATEVDETVKNQENPVTSTEDRTPEDTTERDSVVKNVEANEVDETVRNQENPFSEVSERESTNDTVENRVAEMAPAQEVDVTVRNQESLGSAEVVDRNPDPELVEDPITGAIYDVSKSDRELVDPDKEETEARRARLSQTEGVLNAKEIDGPEDQEAPETPSKFAVEFLESGLSVLGRVWKKGQILELEDVETTREQNKDTNGDIWYELSAEEQKERYGKVFFEKR
jgi:hypothetical protein